MRFIPDSLGDLPYPCSVANPSPAPHPSPAHSTSPALYPKPRPHWGLASEVLLRRQTIDIRRLCCRPPPRSGSALEFWTGRESRSASRKGFTLKISGRLWVRVGN
ncbi:rCG59573, isoform CRA_a [Rattus norvegicus]|uniref:RCG59573, isoform CRA_a n=1 Tax=Rattus norvegicus TaxID=10116 RepID=A6HSS7_RAT|nr:rCG59573, isoform CRA_a [Rattus norvegicus]